jgi:hypothetical protein
VTDSGDPLRVAIRILAAGAPLADVAGLASKYLPGRETPVTIDEVRSTAFETARLLERRSLSPPGMVAFRADARGLLSGGGADPLVGVDLSRLPALAVEMLDWLVSPTAHVDAEPPERLRLAAAYAAAVVWEDDHRRAWQQEGHDEFLRRGATKDDDARLEDFFLVRGWRGSRPHLLLSDWVGLVEGLESGRDYDVLEYGDWLARRDTLETAIGLVTPPAASAARRELEPWDERFHATTRPASGESLRALGPDWSPHRWWWFRLPENEDALRW